VPLANVSLVTGDTALTPDQGPTYGSQSIQSGGMQIRQAAATARNALMAQSQVRLFLVAPADRQTYLRPPGRECLRDFDHAKLNSAKQCAIAEV
jgi:CO/xanthine dehydrogenase Mo-binding subunit